MSNLALTISNRGQRSNHRWVTTLRAPGRRGGPRAWSAVTAADQTAGGEARRAIPRQRAGPGQGCGGMPGERRRVASTSSVAMVRSLMLRRCEIVRKAVKASSGPPPCWAITIPIA